MLNIVLFGPPGAGKGTQSQKLIEKYNLVHLSTGDLLRGEIAAGTALGLEAKKLMDAGTLVPDEVVIAMISTKLDQNPNAKGFIFDGFPRTVAQAEALDQLLAEKGTSISGMIALEVDDEELTKRLLLRGRESGRADDQDESVIRTRIQEYNNKTAPLKAYYSNQDKFESIKGTGSIDEIFDALSEVMDAKKEKSEESVTTKVVNLVKAVKDRVMPSSDESPEEAVDRIMPDNDDEEEDEDDEEENEGGDEDEDEKDEQPSLIQRVVKAVKKVVKKVAPAKAAVKAVKKTATAAKKAVKKTAAAPKKAAKKAAAAPKKAAKKVVKKAVKKVVKKAAQKAAPKKTVKAAKRVAKKVVKKAVKKAAPKKAVKAVKKAAKKAIKKVAPKKALKKAVKKVAPKKAAKKVIRKAAKKAAPKKAIKAVKKAAKKVVKKAAPKKTVKKAIKKTVKKAAPKKAAKKAAKRR